MSNLEAWLTALETTDKKQGTGKLCSTNVVEGTLRYCCLGLGSEMAGIEAVWPVLEYDEEPDYAYFAGYSDLGPREFIDWLGVPIKDGRERIGEYDLVLDTDLEMTVRLGHGTQAFTAANLNDGGCTFAQIAQTIRYFGIRWAA